MELLNNRYRIIRNIEQYEDISSYFAYDLVKRKGALQVNILNSEYVMSELTDCFIDNFISYKSVDNSSILKCYEFGLINTEDGTRLENKEYYYTNECIETSEDIGSFIGSADFSDIIDMFIQVCRAVNYLHNKGIIYGGINTHNILASRHEDKITIKLRDIASVRFEQYCRQEGFKESLLFKPEAKKAVNTADISEDIYSLGILLFVLCIGDLRKACTIIENEGIAVYIRRNNEKHEYGHALSLLGQIICRMISANRKESYRTVHKVIEDINKVLGTNYEILNKEEIEKLNFDVKLAGREKSLNFVMSLRDLLLNQKDDKSFVMVHGEAGIGKTRLLKEIDYRLSIRKSIVYSSYELDNSIASSSSAFIEILKKLCADADAETLELYKYEVMNFIPDLDEKKDAEMSGAFQLSVEKYRLLDRCLNFIKDVTKSSPTTLIIDNADLADEFTLNFLEYINVMHSDKIMVIISYCDGEITGNKIFSGFIDKIKNSGKCEEIVLEGLPFDDAVCFAKSILSTSRDSLQIFEDVYSHSFGNPLFMQEIFQNLLMKNAIYIDEKTGEWKRHANYKSFLLPESMEQVVFDEIKDIDEENRELLNIISIFNSPVPLEYVVNILGKNEDKVLHLLEILDAKGIIRSDIKDRDINYSFKNKVLKSLVYTRINDEDRKNYHRAAAEILKEKYEKKYNAIDELIYHLELAGQIEETIDYCIESSERMKKIKLNDMALKKLEKALKLLEYIHDDKVMLNVLYRMSIIYCEENKWNSAVNFLEKAYALADETSSYKELIDILNKLFEVYNVKNNPKMAHKYLQLCKKAIQKVDYREGEIELRIHDIVYHIDKGSIQKAYEICKKYIDYYKDKYPEDLGEFYHQLGCICMDRGQWDEAMKVHRETLRYYEEHEDIDGIIAVLNNIGVTYSDYYMNDEEAIKYFNKMRQLSEEHRKVKTVAFALCNMGDLYYTHLDYKASLKHFEESLKKSRIAEKESITFYCYNYLSNVYLKLYNYEKAYEYHMRCRRELEDYPVQGVNIINYFYHVALMSYEFADYKTAAGFIKKEIKFLGDDDFISLYNSNTLLKIIQIAVSKDSVSIGRFADEIIEITKNIGHIDAKLDLLCDAAILLHLKNHKDLCKKIYNIISEDEEKNKVQRIKAKILFLEAVFSKRDKSIELLEKVINIAGQENDRGLLCRACIDIGGIYYDRGNYFYALNYFSEAADIIKSLTMQMPEEYRLNFLNKKYFLKPFKRLLDIRAHYVRDDASPKLKDKISDKEDIEKLFNYRYLEGITDNKYFIRTLKKIYNMRLPEGINNLQDIVTNMKSDPVTNLEMLTKYLSTYTFATKVRIALRQENNTFEVIAANDGNSDIPEGMNSIIEKDAAEPLIIKNENGLKGIKAMMCVPINVEYGIKNDYSQNDRRKSSLKSSSGNALAYLYFESEKIINNFNEETLSECMELSPFIDFIIEEYKLRIISSIDMVTGAYTRKYFEDALNDIIKYASENNEKFSIIMFDLDNFKSINDKFGHPVGDMVLSKISSVVKKHMRRNDIFSRYGGEEFIIIMPSTGIVHALDITEKLREDIYNDDILDGKIPVTISAGISGFPEHGCTKPELIEKADKALYVAKQAGKNRCTLWNNGIYNKGAGSDKLSGIISGNAVSDYRHVLVMAELLELIKQDMDRSMKLNSALGRVLEIVEAEECMLFTVRDGKIKEIYGRKAFYDKPLEVYNYNKKLVETVISKKHGINITDWNNATGYDVITGMPFWNSIIAVPIMKNSAVRAVLYITVPVRQKEFRSEEFNFANTLAQMMVTML